MVDLVILLIISIAVTAGLGLLLAGFVLAPWLIGLVLVVLLMALMRVAHSGEQQLAVEPTPDEGIPSPEQYSEPEGADEVTEPVMYYRGVKYKRTDPQPSHPTPAPTPAVEAECKYRGHPWKPSA
jgi:hypothetical protein